MEVILLENFPFSAQEFHIIFVSFIIQDEVKFVAKKVLCKSLSKISLFE